MNTTPHASAQTQTHSTATLRPDQDQAEDLADTGLVTVIGATGKTGSRVASRLERLGLRVRRVSRTSPVPFLWEDEGTWDAALEASSAAYIAFSPDLAVPGTADVIAQLARRAKALGIERAVILSGRGEPLAQEAEQALLAELPASAVVRCSWFMQNFSEGLMRDAVLAGAFALPAPGTALEPFLDLDDLADVAVHALTQPGNEGVVHELTGPAAISLDDAADLLGRAMGRPVAFVPVSVEEFADQLAGVGMPRDDATALGQLFAELLDGRNVHPTDGVERALGRPATSFAEWAARAAGDRVWS